MSLEDKLAAIREMAKTRQPLTSPTTPESARLLFQRPRAADADVRAPRPATAGSEPATVGAVAGARPAAAPGRPVHEAAPRRGRRRRRVAAANLPLTVAALRG